MCAMDKHLYIAHRTLYITFAHVIDIPITSTFTERTLRPDWLRVKLPIGENYRKVRELVDHYKLHTICQSGNCPNMGECWAKAQQPL